MIGLKIPIRFILATVLLWLCIHGNAAEITSNSFFLSLNEKDSFQCHLFTPSKKGQYPLIVFAGGSGGESVYGFTYRKWAGYASDSFAVATMEKVGVSVGSDPAKLSPLFYHYDHKEARVSACNILIDHLKRSGTIDTGNIFLVGYSEGTEVMASVASGRNDISKLVMMAGGGLCQTEELRILAEKRFGIFGGPAIRILDHRFEKIMANPSEHKFWLGLTWKRWESYFKACPVDDLIKLEIPIMMIHGNLDKNSPVESSRYVKNLFIESGKTNLYLLEMSGCDHSFREGKKDRIFEAIEIVIHWIKA